jgi:hypothetical protein
MRKVSENLKRSLRWVWGHKIRAAILLVVLTLALPKPVRSQFVDPCCALMAAGLSTISSHRWRPEWDSLRRTRHLEVRADGRVAAEFDQSGPRPGGQLAGHFQPS